jgi:hypothetical protein
LRFASRTHRAENTGANRITNAGCTDWNQPAGISKPPTKRSVWRLANRFIEDPACSKPDQNSAHAMNITSTTCTRRRSAGSSPAPKNRYRKYAAAMHTST